MNNEAVDNIISSFEFYELFKDEKAVKFYTNIPSLNSIVKGFELGELIILSGPTKHGKTTMFQTLTKQFADNQIYSVWFSYEVASKQLIKRFLPELPLFFLPNVLKGKSIDYLYDKIKEAKEKYAVRVVFIDHLHYLLDLGKVKNPSLEIGTVIRGLKIIAVELEVVIFLAAHTTKLKTNAEPTAEDIRDSSFIGQESDCVMILWRGKKEGESNLKVEFHRRVGITNKTVKLKFNSGLLEEANNVSI